MKLAAKTGTGQPHLAEGSAWEAAAEQAKQVPAIVISGATGPNAVHVNGVFELMVEEASGAPVWRRADGAAYYLFLATESQKWTVGGAKSMTARKAVGVACSKKVGAGVLPMEAREWSVFMGSSGKWQTQPLQVGAVSPPCKPRAHIDSMGIHPSTLSERSDGPLTVTTT